MSRLTFVKQLARELVLPHLERRYHNQRLPYELRTSIRRVLGVQAECAEYAPAQEDKLEKRKTCYTCMGAKLGCHELQETFDIIGNLIVAPFGDILRHLPFRKSYFTKASAGKKC
nr:unnamed protein product [Callosobruchus chinensis]